MTVNVSLCGSIPRSEMMSCASRLPRLDLKQTALQASQFATNKNSNCVVTMAASSLMSRKVSDDNVVSSSQVVEPPSWAVPARGEAILEVSIPIQRICLIFIFSVIGISFTHNITISACL